jgi:hypothetical protein
MSKPEKLFGYPWVIAANKMRKRFGIPYPEYIDNVRLVTLISGKPTKVFFLQNITEPFTKTPAKPIGLSALMVR